MTTTTAETTETEDALPADYKFELEHEERRELAAAVVTILEAAGFGTKLWPKDPGRVYVTRRLSRRVQEMGYVQVLSDGTRNYNAITRATATISTTIDGDPRIEEPLAEMKRKDEARVRRVARLAAGTAET